MIKKLLKTSQRVHKTLKRLQRIVGSNRENFQLEAFSDLGNSHGRWLYSFSSIFRSIVSYHLRMQIFPFPYFQQQRIVI